MSTACLVNLTAIILKNLRLLSWRCLLITFGGNIVDKKESSLLRHTCLYQ